MLKMLLSLFVMVFVVDAFAVEEETKKIDDKRIRTSSLSQLLEQQSKKTDEVVQNIQFSHVKSGIQVCEYKLRQASKSNSPGRKMLILILQQELKRERSKAEAQQIEAEAQQIKKEKINKVIMCKINKIKKIRNMFNITRNMKKMQKLTFNECFQEIIDMGLMDEFLTLYEAEVTLSGSYCSRSEDLILPVNYALYKLKM